MLTNDVKAEVAKVKGGINYEQRLISAINTVMSHLVERDDENDVECPELDITEDDALNYLLCMRTYRESSLKMLEGLLEDTEG